MQDTDEKNIAILCNLLAGAGSAGLLAKKISGKLVNRNITHTLFIQSWPEQFYSFTDIFIVGGDGTLNYFINQYPGFKLPLVIFKGGTGNDFHWMLYGNQTLEEQLRLVLNTSPHAIDMGKCNERYFINGVGIGFEGEVAKALTRKKKLSGKTSFLICILKKIFTYRSKIYSINSAEKKLTARKLLVDISNGRRAGGGFYVAPEAKADDGLLDIVMADAMNSFQRLRYLPIIEKGKHLNLRVIQHFCSTKITINSNAIIQYHLDGEYFEATGLNIEILPAALQFRY